MSCVSLPACFICSNSCFGFALLHLLRSSSLKISGVASPRGGLTRSRGVSRGKGGSTSSTTSPLHDVTAQAVLRSKKHQTYMMCISAEPTCQCNMRHHLRRIWRHQNQFLLTIEAAAHWWQAAQLAHLQPKAWWLHWHCPLPIQPLGSK